MLFSLCLRLGYPHPDHLLDQLTGLQLQDWLRFYARQPFDDQRMDLGFAQICALIANLFPGKRVSVSDFMPYTEKPKQDPQQAERLLRAQFAHLVRKKNEEP